MRSLLSCVVLVSACSARGPSPRISSVEPSVVPPGSATTITIHGSNFYDAVHVQLDDNTVTVDRQWAVAIGGDGASSVARIDANTIIAVVPVDLAPGPHDVMVVSPAGSTATAHGALTVAPLDMAPACNPPVLPATVMGPALAITISNAQISGGGNVGHVSPGAQFTLSAAYSIQDNGCCIDQILVGIAPDKPQACLFDGLVPASGANGTNTIVLTAPTAPGLYTLRFHYGQALSCDPAWWDVNGAPTAAQDFAAICVP